MRLGVPLVALVALVAAGSVAQAHDAGRTADHPSLDVRVTAMGAPAQAPPARSLAAATGDDRRYALANGCYALRAASGFAAKSAGGYGATSGSAGAADAFRMQATALGSYLFYGRDRDFMAAGPLNTVAPANGASPSADWRVDANPDGTFKVTLPSANKALGVTAGRLVLVDPASAGAFGFEPQQGCAVYPEVETSASGTPFRSATEWGQVRGLIDLHLHMTAFEFLGGRAHCGRPWHPYGAPYALVDMARGAEAYLQAWERVEGIRFGCKSGRQRATRRGLGRIRLGASAARLLRRAGQPRVRGSRAWKWCVRGKRNRGRRVAAALTPGGEVALAGSNAKGSEARRIRVGDPAARLEGHARRVGKRLFVRRAGSKARLVYGVREGRVRFVGVGTRDATRSRRALHRYLRLAGLR